MTKDTFHISTKWHHLVGKSLISAFCEKISLFWQAFYNGGWGEILLSVINKRGATGRGLKVVRAFTNSWGGPWNLMLSSRNLMLSSNLLKSKIPFVGGGGIRGIWCWVQICWNPKFHLWGGGGGGFAEFDTEFKFAKIQNSILGGGGGLWNLMLSSDLLKSKILICGGGGGVGGTNFQLLMLSSNLLKKI